MNIFKKIIPFMASTALSTTLLANTTPFYIGSDTPQASTFSLKQLDSGKNIATQENLWYLDFYQQAEEELCFVHVTKVLANGRSPFQEYTVIDTKNFGKVLLIDGEVQSAQIDEHIYHESFIHPAMVAHPNPKSVLVIGAGEGATAREILKHPSVERLVLVDIDGDVIQAVKQHLPEWHQGTFDHPKTELLIMCGKEFVEKTNEKFDVIYIDICDKLVKDSPVTELYSPKFYASVKKILSQNGILALQAMQLFPEMEGHLSIISNLKQVFPCVETGGAYIPSFVAMWGFAFASNQPICTKLSSETVDSILDKRNLSNKLNHYDGETHRNLFSLPKGIRQVIQENS
ncbi:MAG: hypothetical protein JSR46_03730 [Verrucomicrobia bacterium]|nr:hypothetical protein [Verrucomicrobiota bacterium]